MKCPHCGEEDDKGKMIEPVCYQDKKPVSWFCNCCGKFIYSVEKKVSA